MAKLAIIDVVEHNPNDQTGGGGCLCSDTKRPECVGPFVVFKATSSDSGNSPYNVACVACLQDGVIDAQLARVAGGPLRPTTDKFFVGGTLMSATDRLPGHGLRDETYVPINAEDAKLIRDGSPGAAEAPAVTDITPVATATGEPTTATSEPVIDAPPSATPASIEPVVLPPVAEPPVAEPPVAEPPVSEPPVAEPPVAEPPVAEPPVAEPPVAEPPVAEPPVAEPPVAEPPVAEPPVAEPPVAEPPVAEPPVAEPPASFITDVAHVIETATEEFEDRLVKLLEEDTHVVDSILPSKRAEMKPDSQDPWAT